MSLQSDPRAVYAPALAKPYGAVVAIPACNEASRIEECLAALAIQRDRHGAPLPADSFEILVYANNCTDETAELARRMSTVVPQAIVVVTEQRADKSAGLARRRAMDLAAERLRAVGQNAGYILTTDADSSVCSTWISATLNAFAAGVDGVAGYVDAQPSEWLALGAAFTARGRAEDIYLSLMAELQSLCDPRPHDPWPNHRVSSGASLAVSLAAYQAIGGLPPLAVGEDAALTAALEQHGFLVRHSMDVCVTTSCRLEGRAQGGAADTMRLRCDVPDAPCDDELEAAFLAARRFLWRSRLRHMTKQHLLRSFNWADRLTIQRSVARELVEQADTTDFAAFWVMIQAASSVLGRSGPLRPSDLARETKRARLIISAMRSAVLQRGAQAGMSHRLGKRVPADD